MRYIIHVAVQYIFIYIDGENKVFFAKMCVIFGCFVVIIQQLYHKRLFTILHLKLFNDENLFEIIRNVIDNKPPTEYFIFEV